MNTKNPLSRIGDLVRYAVLAMVAAPLTQAGAAEVWNGPLITFVKPNGADWTQPVNQDRMTTDVWLTRGATMGLFNAATESSYTHFSSPAGTEWAYGMLPNYSSLSYSNWENWNMNNPPSMVGRDAVLHLIADDIYLSIRFNAWGGNAGGFSYQRSTLAVPEPSTGLMLLVGLAAGGTVQLFRLRLRVPSAQAP